MHSLEKKTPFPVTLLSSLKKTLYITPFLLLFCVYIFLRTEISVNNLLTLRKTFTSYTVCSVLGKNLLQLPSLFTVLGKTYSYPVCSQSSEKPSIVTQFVHSLRKKPSIVTQFVHSLRKNL